MIDVRGLTKSYGSNLAVAAIDLNIAAGETFGLLGPNGAGKTTSILMMVGAIRPDQGQITIDGMTDPTQPAVRRRIGFSPQRLSLYDQLTAEENLAFFGRIYGLRGDTLRQRISWGLQFAGLTDRRKDRVATYSGGMQRRLNLACAMVHNPPVVFMDEPTVGVDPQSRNHIFESIETLQNAGCTILYTTHYMEEAQRLCDRVAIMDHGRILAVDTIDNLIHHHGGRSVVVAELSSFPPDHAILPSPLDGMSLRFETQQPLEDVSRLFGSGINFRSLKIDRPDLETVFLSLTGRSLRD